MCRFVVGKWIFIVKMVVRILSIFIFFFVESVKLGLFVVMFLMRDEKKVILKFLLKLISWKIGMLFLFREGGGGVFDSVLFVMFLMNLSWVVFGLGNLLVVLWWIIFFVVRVMVMKRRISWESMIVGIDGNCLGEIF